MHENQNLIEDFHINWVYVEKSDTGISLQNLELDTHKNPVLTADLVELYVFI